jgi:hypothetical protein
MCVGAPVTERARLRAGALGAHREAEAVEAAQRSAARRDRVDAQHRRAHAHAADHRLEAAQKLAGLEQRDVGRRAAHVEATARTKPARAATAVAPTTPPAGPDSSAFGPRKRSASVSPPEDCMKRSSASGSVSRSAAAWPRRSGVR